METNIISVKYESEYNPRTFIGKSYSYYTNTKLEVGDIVQVPTCYGLNIARVSRINIPEEEIKNIKPYMKTVIRKIDKNRYLNFAEIQEDVA